MLKDTSEGQTHYQNDGCGEPEHNSTKPIKECPTGQHFRLDGEEPHCNCKNMTNFIDKKIHEIIQEEVADRAIYQDRSAEEALRRGLQSAESRLEVMFRQALTHQLDELKGKVEGMKKRDCDELEATGTCGHFHNGDEDYNLSLSN